jgi:hypothetical protein
MMRPDPQQLRAFQELRGHTAVVEYLQTWRDSVRDQLVSQADVDVLRVLQGQARTVETLLFYILSDQPVSGKRP